MCRTTADGVTDLVSVPLRVRDLVLDEDEVLDRRRLLQNILELGQELVRGDDVGDLGLKEGIQ